MADEGERLVKRFDFDERLAGNLESVPMRWVPHRAKGFPEFTRGRFDEAAGFNGAPSFYLPLDGRSCAYHYTGRDTIVEARSDYRIVARVRADQLNDARAFVTAHYRDASGNALDDTIRASRLLSSREPGWQELSIRLPANMNAAHSIGVSVWVVQPEIWSLATRPPLHIEPRDVHGGAWFDDIMIFRLPRVRLSSTAAEAGHIFEPGVTPELLPELADSIGDIVPAVLRVTDASGGIVKSLELDPASAGVGRRRVPLPNLRPGFYRASLSVSLREGVRIERVLRFVSLAPERWTAQGSRRLGLLMNHEERRDWAGEHALIHHLGVDLVKVPIVVSSLNSAQPGLDGFIQKLATEGIEMAGVLTGSTTELDTLIDRLNAPNAEWSADLIRLVTRFEGLLTTWQIGEDGLFEALRDERYSSTLHAVRAEMSKVAATPILIAPWSVQQGPPTPPLAANILSSRVATGVHAADVGEFFTSDRPRSDYEAVWALMESHSPDAYRRLPAIADFAKRLIFALQTPVERVIVRQPWANRHDGTAVTAMVDERYSVLRTLVSMLDDARFIGPMDVGDGVTCFAFDRNGEAILVLWDDQTAWDGSQRDLYLGGATHLTDLWGRETKLARTSSNDAQITVSPLPVFVHPASTWLVQFRQGLQFDPHLLPSETSVHELHLLMHNPRNEPVSGTIRLRNLPGWRIRPSTIHYVIQPGESVRRPIQVQASPREPAGLKQISAAVTIEASRIHQFEVKLPLMLDLADMEVWADLRLEGGRLIIRHGVTNRSDDIVTFRSLVDAPRRRRQHLNIIGLAPGRSIIKQHVLGNAAELSGKVIRVGLKQLRGRRTHDLTLEVP